MAAWTRRGMSMVLSQDWVAVAAKERLGAPTVPEMPERPTIRLTEDCERRDGDGDAGAHSHDERENRGWTEARGVVGRQCVRPGSGRRAREAEGRSQASGVERRPGYAFEGGRGCGGERLGRGEDSGVSPYGRRARALWGVRFESPRVPRAPAPNRRPPHGRRSPAPRWGFPTGCHALGPRGCGSPCPGTFPLEGTGRRGLRRLLLGPPRSWPATWLLRRPRRGCPGPAAGSRGLRRAAWAAVR